MSKKKNLTTIPNNKKQNLTPKPNKGKITIAWCDNGLVDGKFTEGLMTVGLQAPINGIPISHIIRVHGNQIGRQRQGLVDHWIDNVDSDWLLFIDSDIEITTPMIAALWKLADAKERPIVTGIYFISKGEETTLEKPTPCIFKRTDDHTITSIHPLPENELIQVDSAGLGLVIIHKSVFLTIRKMLPGDSFFAEELGSKGRFIGEDIVFFNKVFRTGIPVYAHTGILARHIKRFSLDMDYYAMWWTMEEMKKRLAEYESSDGHISTTPND